MKLLNALVFIVLFSCNQNETEKDTGKIKSDSISLKEGENTSGTANDSTVITETKLSKGITAIINENSEVKSWQILNDKTARWINGQFEFFIQPKRKKNQDYPYITQGDFNNDKKQDVAALLIDSTRTKYQLAIISDFDSIPKLSIWKEDIKEHAAISAIPVGEITGTVNEKIRKVKLSSEAILVEYFEKASFIIYWNGNSYTRIQQGD
jgi:hypothetical protein